MRQNPVGKSYQPCQCGAKLLVFLLKEESAARCKAVTLEIPRPWVGGVQVGSGGLFGGSLSSFGWKYTDSVSSSGSSSNFGSTCQLRPQKCACF